MLLLRLAHGLVELAVEEPPEPELPRSGLGSTHLQHPAREGDHMILVSSMHGLKVVHAVRLDAEHHMRDLLCGAAAMERAVPALRL